MALRLGLVSYRNLAGPTHWLPFLLSTLIFFLAILEIALSRKRFEALEEVIVTLVADANPQAIRRWYQRRVNQMYDSRSSVVTGLLLAPAVGLVQWYIGFGSWLVDPILRAFDTIVVFLLFGAAASSQWPFYNISYFVSQLPKKSLRANFFRHPKDNVLAIGSFLMWIDLGGVFLVFLSAALLWIIPVRIPVPIYVLLLVVFGWAVLWFFLTQFHLHQVMTAEKRQRLGLLASELERISAALARGTTHKLLQEYEGLRSLHQDVSAFPEWPFRFANVVTLVTGILVPVALTFLDLLMSSP